MRRLILPLACSLVSLTFAATASEGERPVSSEKSVYDRMEFKSGKAVAAPNREPVDTPAKAMERYNQMKQKKTVKMIREEQPASAETGVEQE